MHAGVRLARGSEHTTVVVEWSKARKKAWSNHRTFLLLPTQHRRQHRHNRWREEWAEEREEAHNNIRGRQTEGERKEEAKTSCGTAEGRRGDWGLGGAFKCAH